MQNQNDYKFDAKSSQAGLLPHVSEDFAQAGSGSQFEGFGLKRTPWRLRPAIVQNHAMTHCMASLPKQRGRASARRRGVHEMTAILRIADDEIPGGANVEKAAAILLPLPATGEEGSAPCSDRRQNLRLSGSPSLPDEHESGAFCPSQSGCRAARPGQSSFPRCSELLRFVFGGP